MEDVQHLLKNQSEWLTALTSGSDFLLVLEASSLKIVACSQALLTYWYERNAQYVDGPMSMQEFLEDELLHAPIDRLWHNPMSQCIENLKNIQFLGSVQHLSDWCMGHHIEYMRWQALSISAPQGEQAILMRISQLPDRFDVAFLRNTTYQLNELSPERMQRRNEIFHRFYQENEVLGADLSSEVLDNLHPALFVVKVCSNCEEERIIYINAAFAKWIKKMDLEHILSEPLLNWSEDDIDQNNLKHLKTYLRLHDVYEFDLRLAIRNVHVRFFWNRIYKKGKDDNYWAVYLHDETRMLQESEMNRARAHSMLKALEGIPLAVSLKSMLSSLEQIWAGWSIGVIYLEENGQSRLLGSPPESMRQWLEQIPFSYFEKIWQIRDPYKTARSFVIQDVQNHPDFQTMKEQLQNFDLSTFIEYPLYNTDRQLIGVLAASHSRIIKPQPQLIERLQIEAGVIALLMEKERQQEILRNLAYYDALTGLYNREAFNRDFEFMLEKAKNHKAPLAVALLDLNRFKQVNDGLGHAIGDELLCQLARRFEYLAKKYQLEALTRMGGDEFAFLLQCSSMEEMNRSMKALEAGLHELFERPFDLLGRNIYVGMAMGWSVYPENADDRSTLLRQADAAMYVAKRSQINIKIHRSQHLPHARPLDLENALYEALSEQQFHIVYQPQVTCHDQSLAGVEALIRWNHPEMGAITPDEFIPMAEATGMIVPIGAWVLKTACHEVQGWPDPTISLSVNVSPIQLRHEDFADMVRNILYETNFEPYRLVVEVTETALLGQQEQMHNLQMLRELGVRVSVDDFGTGYSTLLSLKNLMTDELKIDRTFVQEIDAQGKQSEENLAIVRATITLAQSLKLDVVAEGVETEEQYERLRNEGCQLMQGWHIAPGMTASKFKERFLVEYLR